MSVKRFILDSGILDQDRIIGVGTIVLDQRAVLDNNIIAGTDYNAKNFYDDNQVLYSGSKVIYDFAESAMGGLSAIIESVPQVQVTAQANFGYINAVSSTKVTHYSSSSAELGLLISEVISTPTVLPLFEAPLGSLIASIEATPIVDISAQAVLGSLIAEAQSITPEPPQPEQGQYGSNGYVPIKPKKKEKPKPNPFIAKIPDTPELPNLIKTIFASGQSDLGGITTTTQNRIDFSIFEDDMELLLIL